MFKLKLYLVTLRVRMYARLHKVLVCTTEYVGCKGQRASELQARTLISMLSGIRA